MPAMVSVDAARAQIRAALPPLAAERVALAEAAGRVLASPLRARMSQPPFDASAMDGYAVRFDDLRTHDRLRVVGVSAAGARFAGSMQAGDAVRIFTGAPMPDGADHVVIQEEAARENDALLISARQTRRSNVRGVGADFTSGAVLLDKGARLDGPQLALAAAADIADLEVVRRPRVALIANGDELVMPGAPRTTDQVVCSIPFALAPMIDGWGGEAAFLGIAADDFASIKSLAQRAREFDLIVPIGGASVGDRDFMRAAFAELGFAPVFEKVAMKPGKPTWFATHSDAAVIGLPGNPASAIVSSVLFVKTAIDAMLGRAPQEYEVARLTTKLAGAGPRENFLRAKMHVDASGQRLVALLQNQDSSLLSVIAAANALIQLPPESPELNVGDPVRCVAF